MPPNSDLVILTIVAPFPPESRDPPDTAEVGKVLVRQHTFTKDSIEVSWNVVE